MDRVIFASINCRTMDIGLRIFFVNKRQHNITQNTTSLSAGLPSQFGLCNKWRKAREFCSLAFLLPSLPFPTFLLTIAGGNGTI